MDNSREILTREELDFLLAPVDFSSVTDEESSDASREHDAPDDERDEHDDAPQDREDEAEDGPDGGPDDAPDDEPGNDPAGDAEDADEDDDIVLLPPVVPGQTDQNSQSDRAARDSRDARAARDTRTSQCTDTALSRTHASASGSGQHRRSQPGKQRQAARRADLADKTGSTRFQRQGRGQKSRGWHEPAGHERGRHDQRPSPPPGLDNELAANPVLRARAQFFAGLLEEDICAATKAHVRIAPLSATWHSWEEVLADMESPAFYALCRAGRADVLMCCDAVATQALADVSLGAGSLGALGGSPGQRSALSFFDRELVRRCLERLPALLAKAFDQPSCTLSRTLWSADDIFLTALDEEVCCVHFSLDIDGHGGAAMLVLPQRAQVAFGAG